MSFSAIVSLSAATFPYQNKKKKKKTAQLGKVEQVPSQRGKRPEVWELEPALPPAGSGPLGNSLPIPKCSSQMVMPLLASHLLSTQ